jgi:large subunit ribosomal protein L23
MSFSKQRRNFGWCTSDYFSLIKYPIFTEKSDSLRAQNQYTFAVDPILTKVEIKVVIQELFNVKVKSVNTITTMRASKKGRLQKRVSRSKTKVRKAIVTLASGSSIDLLKVNV